MWLGRGEKRALLAPLPLNVAMMWIGTLESSSTKIAMNGPIVHKLFEGGGGGAGGKKGEKKKR